MEIALPHVVVRMFGPGVGFDLVGALSTHPVEVSEARDAPEARRVAGGRPAVLVVVTDPPDTEAAVAETRVEFPDLPILLVAGGGGSAAAGRGVDTVAGGGPLDVLCWHVLEATSRAVRRRGVVERPLGPVAIDVDRRAVIVSDTAGLDEFLVDGRRMRAGGSILEFIDPRDRASVVAGIEDAFHGATRFCTFRILNDRGGRHPSAVGMRDVGGGRVRLLVQPLVSGGMSTGRRVNSRDPITGLFTRWAMSRALDSPRGPGPAADREFVVMLRIDDCAAIADRIGHLQTDVVLMRVAAAMILAFPHPALTSRLMGDTFLACLFVADDAEMGRRADDLIRQVGRIDVPAVAPGFTLRASVGIAAVAAGDHDLAIRQAEVAVAEARAAGGNRAVVAGSASLTAAQATEFTADMDLGSWEVWLQPVAAAVAAPPAFHECLARFDLDLRRVVPRADFFVAGRAAGLLERFDRMMLLRALAILAANPDTRLSVNVSHETFATADFPGSFLDVVRALPGACERLIVEIAPRCLAAPAADVRWRLTALADAGIAVAVDDFGSGICRLAFLTQFPLAIVKLDELVTGYVDDDPLQREFVRTVVSLCRARGITTVAEYTRSLEQLMRLRDDGVDLFQGELFGLPRPAGEVLSAPVVEVSRA